MCWKRGWSCQSVGSRSSQNGTHADWAPCWHQSTRFPSLRRLSRHWLHRLQHQSKNTLIFMTIKKQNKVTLLVHTLFVLLMFCFYRFTPLIIYSFSVYTSFGIFGVRAVFSHIKDIVRPSTVSDSVPTVSGWPRPAMTVT